MVNFNKQALSAEEQLKVLINRGLIVEDKQSAIKMLNRIGYYRLSAYMRNFQEGNNHNFVSGTTFKQVLDLYNFDEQLREVCFNATRKIEIAYRAAITNVLSKKYDSHWFLHQEAFTKPSKVNDCIDLIQHEIKKKNSEYAETFIAKYYEKYDNPNLPPFWMIAETLTIGSLNRVYQLISSQNKREVIEFLGFDFDKKFIVITNWLQVICVVRNICAHHSRLFNRVFRIKPTIHTKIEELKNAPDNTFYYIAMVINYYLKTISDDISFEENLINLFKKNPHIDKTQLGFPADWQRFTITKIQNNPVVK